VSERCPSCAEPLKGATVECPFCAEKLRLPSPSPDDEHLRLPSVFHYVLSGITAIFACFPLLHVGLGLALHFSPETFAGKGSPPPPAIGLLFACLGGVFVLLGWTLATLMFLAGRALAARRRRALCTFTAAAECLLMPFGTILGVFTLVVLSRPSVQARFDRP
jgi:hypothetical protein